MTNERIIMEFSVLKDYTVELGIEKEIETEIRLKLNFSDFDYELICDTNFPHKLPKIKIRNDDKKKIEDYIETIKLGEEYYGIIVTDDLYLLGLYESDIINPLITIFQYIKIANNFFTKINNN